MGEPRLHVEVTGDGPCLVLAHGFGGSARNFRPQARALAPAYRVVTSDARGHARSEAPAGASAYALPALVADFGRALERGGARRAVCGGLSLGALVALHFARAHRERALALVLASFPAGAGGGAARALANRAAAFADALEREGLDGAGARFVWGEDSGLDPEGAALVRQGFLEHDPAALAHTLRETVARAGGDLFGTPWLAELDLPALLVAGERDAGSLASSRALAGRLPRAELAVVADAGHVVNLAQPARFNEVLRTFLERVAPAGAGAQESSRSRRNG